MLRKYIFLFFLLFIPQIINAQSEIIQNGGFETGDLSPWICYAGTEDDPFFIPCDIVTNTEAYEGEYSLEIGAGMTPLNVKQEFSPPVIAGGTLSFWVLIPSTLDPGDCYEGCALSFSLSVKYSDSQQFYSITSQLTGSGWKKIDIPVSQSDEIIAIVFTAYEINTLHIDEVSLPATTTNDEFPWELFYPAFIKKPNQQEQSN